MAGQASEVEETIKRLQGHKGVIGVVIVNQDGIPIRTTFDQAVTVQYAGLITQLCSKARSAIRELDPQVRASVFGCPCLSPGECSFCNWTVSTATMGRCLPLSAAQSPCRGRMNSSEQRRHLLHVCTAAFSLTMWLHHVCSCAVQNDLTFLRLRSKKHEIMVAPDKDYLLIIIQDPNNL